MSKTAGAIENTPEFVNVDLTEMMNEGVLMAANEAFFWPLGLALAWNVPTGYKLGDGPATDLEISEWRWADGHHEMMVDEPDEVSVDRHARFAKWVETRLASMPPEEAAQARVRLGLEKP